jgi:RluA family pseudouridine synthase
MSEVIIPNQHQAQFINVAAYKFVALDQLTERRASLLSMCKSLQLKGTILLSSEGINLFLAGSEQNMRSFLDSLRAQIEFSDLEVKESTSDHQPFSRMLVRLKKEIISMGVPEVVPQVQTSPKISAKQLKDWLDQGKQLTLLDTRNDYEYQIGSFENSVLLPIDHFRQFPEAVDNLPQDLKEQPIVMFCTGGIRCEKAGPLMEAKGFKQIYQLDGGILKYFEECGGAHYRGDCFVFDKRVALDPQLKETGLAQCFHCQAILSIEDQQSPLYNPPNSCLNCHPLSLPLQQRLVKRAKVLRDATTPLPGCIPYLNQRPMSVTEKFDQQPLIEFLLSLHAELDRNFWTGACAEGHVRYRNQPLQPTDVVRAGWRLYHLVPNTIEPAVSNEVEFLYEDQNLIALNKPAPLPMHPCGRFNKNSLQNFLRLSYPHETIRILHRLDAETTGVLLLGRDRVTAARLHQQFASGQVRKIYLARVLGHPDSNQFECRAQISGKASGPGGIRQIISPKVETEVGLVVKGQSGNSQCKDLFFKPAITQFEVLDRLTDGTSLIRCKPVTGRTNQIRLHLASLGLPIIGDIGYGSTDELAYKSGALQLADNTFEGRNVVAGANCDPQLAHSARLNLHALELEFEYPPKLFMNLRATPPAWAAE